MQEKVKKYNRILLLLALILCSTGAINAQIVNIEKNYNHMADSIRYEFDHGSYFGFYKDNYFTAGTAINQKPDQYNSDVKFQFSISARLTRSTLPWNTYLYLFFSQKVLWNVFQNSMPMRDLNFNPGIGLSKLLIIKGKLVGKLSLILEHESNGRDGDASRSWNKVSFAGNIFLDPQLMIHGKFWIPIVDGMHNKDILKYSGIYQVGMEWWNKKHRFGASLILTKRSGWNLNFNTTLELSYRVFSRDNMYLFMQYYNGYGECLLDYNKYHSRLRVGICLKPRYFSEY